jgi:hypothetical protein
MLRDATLPVVPINGTANDRRPSHECRRQLAGAGALAHPAMPNEPPESRIERVPALTNIGYLGTVKKDGSPIVSPVEFHVDHLFRRRARQARADAAAWPAAADRSGSDRVHRALHAPGRLSAPADLGARQRRADGRTGPRRTHPADSSTERRRNLRYGVDREVASMSQGSVADGGLHVLTPAGGAAHSWEHKKLQERRSGRIL